MFRVGSADGIKYLFPAGGGEFFDNFYKSAKKDLHFFAFCYTI